MWLDIQAWFPTLALVLIIAACFAVEWFYRIRETQQQRS